MTINKLITTIKCTGVYFFQIQSLHLNTLHFIFLPLFQLLSKTKTAIMPQTEQSFRKSFVSLKQMVPCALSLLALLLDHTTGFSQSQPGGVKGTKAWFVAEKNTAGNFIWKDISGNNHPANVKPADLLSINFHTSLLFDGNAYTAILSNTQLKQSTLISAFYPKYNGVVYANGDKDFYSISYNNRSSYSVNIQRVAKSGVKSFDYSPNFKLPDSRITEAMKIATYYNYQTPSSTIWGEDNERNIGFEFRGYCPEMIIYNRVLTPSERWRVETYLAIKYGLTLGVSYVGKNGDTLWSISENTGYNNRIAAIGKDIPAALKQDRSNTTYEEDNASFFINSDDFTRKKWELHRSLTIGFKDKNMAGLSDGSFLFWGDNNKAVTPTIKISDQKNFPGLVRMERQWKLSNKPSSQLPTIVDISGKLLRNIHIDRDVSFMYFLLQTSKDFSSTLKVYPLSSADTILTQIENEEGELVDVFGNFSRIGWDNIIWNGGAAGDCYFTFGKAPLLQIATIETCRSQEQPPLPKRCVRIVVKGGFPKYKYSIKKDGGTAVNGEIDETGILVLKDLDRDGKYTLEVTDTNITDAARCQRTKKRFQVRKSSIDPL